MKWTIPSCMILGLLSGHPTAQLPADSGAAFSSPQPARDTVDPMSHARFDSAPVVQAPRETSKPKSVERVTRSNPDRSWQLALDFADISDSAVNKRHFNQSEDQTILCCIDAAWLPAASSEGWIRAGAFGSLGGWHQDLPDHTKVTVVDLSVGPTLLGVAPLWADWKGWARVELGVSNLVVDRNTTGMDWGWAGAVRAGLAFPIGDALGFFGGGFDVRDYWHLDVKNVPVLNLFVGVWI